MWIEKKELRKTEKELVKKLRGKARLQVNQENVVFHQVSEESVSGKKKRESAV